MRKFNKFIGVHLLLVLAAMFFCIKVNAQSAVVNVLFFYSPTCPHCHEVIEKDIPIFKKMFGEQLRIIEINTYEQSGAELYMKAVEAYKIPEERQGVPTMIVGDNVLVGSYEIPNILPQLVEDGLSKGGIPIPELPGLSEYIGENGNQPTKQEISFIDRFQRDVLGNSISVIVLIGLLTSFTYNVWQYLKIKQQGKKEIVPLSKVHWLIPIIAFIGLVVAIYLAFVEVTNTEAICGPVGDCNTVQQSPYAKLFGIIPVGVIGVIGFLAIILVWALGQIPSFMYKSESMTLLWGMTLFGVLFASYLTFLEPFVIGATCAWCLTVALCMLILLFLTTPQAALAVISDKTAKPKRKRFS